MRNNLKKNCRLSQLRHLLGDAVAFFSGVHFVEQGRQSGHKEPALPKGGISIRKWHSYGDSNWKDKLTAYDGSGSLTYLNYNGQIYYYERNAQNDVVGLVDSNMNEVVTYSYDTWGQLLNIGGSLAGTLGKLNPFRYRGYYYDSETGLYYLNSRYYDPNTGRFINADGNCGQTGDLLAANMFAYCKNNPVNMSDPKGDSPIPDCILNDMQLSRIVRIAPKYKATKKKKSAGSVAANVAVDTAKNAAEGVADTEVSSAISKLPDVKYGVGRFGPGVGMTLKYADKLESVSILKGVSKTTGVIGGVAYVWDIGSDIYTYHNSQSDLAKALFISVVAIGICISVALICTGAGAPAGVTLAAGIIAGVATGYGEDYAKKEWIGY